MGPQTPFELLRPLYWQECCMLSGIVPVVYGKVCAASARVPQRYPKIAGVRRYSDAIKFLILSLSLMNSGIKLANTNTSNTLGKAFISQLSTRQSSRSVETIGEPCA